MVRTNTYSCRSTSLAPGERPQGIRKETRPLRRSARLQQDRTHQLIQSLLPAPENSGPSSPLQPSTTTQPTGQKRKRSREINTPDQPVQQRQRPASTTVDDAHTGAASDNADSSDPIDYWRKHKHWPRTYFESEGNMVEQQTSGGSSSTPRRKASTSSMTSSDASREKKSTPYQNTRYPLLLETRGSFMGKYVGEGESGPQKKSIDLCGTLLKSEQNVPHDSLFSDEFFEETCEMIQERNEAKVVQDIARLIVPSAQSLSIRGSRHLKILIESVNEAWTKSIPLIRNFPHPKPDYSVGFKWSSFTGDQFEKIKSLVGDIMDTPGSLYGATYYMYFPFLTCEVKCGAAALEIADRQNAHSATLAVRAVVELFRLVKREKELDREILAFSISHDHSNVRIYGHYPVIDGKDTKYYRHPIHKFDFTVMDGKDKWTAYKFTKNVYDNWMPDHFKRICSAIDDIPDVNFDVSQESELQFSSQTGLSQELESHHLSQSEGSASVAGRDDGSSITPVEATTPDTSVSQSFKKPKLK
ncbi:hypothetical protein MPH_13477 [Macrophomina phaseolina MS6]|uniref:DUF7924 domain-containing protein n=1 Tax=Macrophomina phaseolina (strain MS6) TaxID=1126212 RepID=K2R9D9_MACPH|nr:hypothetical protein MPH_13477 [Macrophomina phaseolina MS6]